MVGDSINEDVLAAEAAGWRAIHVDRFGSGSDAAFVVRDIAAVASWLSGEDGRLLASATQDNQLRRLPRRA